MTRVGSRKLTQRPAFGGDDNAFPTCGLRVKARRFLWVTLSAHKWVILDLKGFDFDLTLTGFDLSEVDAYMASDVTTEGLTDEDAVPEVAEQAISAPGDLWVLGNHRLLCGDATVSADVQRLMGGGAADCVFTDPPYNVDYEGYTAEKLKIKGDRMSDTAFRQFLEASFRSYRSFVKPSASLYVLPPVFLAARVPERLGECRIPRPLPDYLGEEHLRLGLRALQRMFTLAF